MTSRSSIFSFNTLKLPHTFPKGAAFAAVLLLAAEMGVRGLMAHGKLEADPSLHKTLQERVDQIKGPNPPDIWILGNSTLDWGVNGPMLEKELGQSLIKLPHGSATVNASAAMLDFYINQTGRVPKRVILTITKDDLNRNGYRASESQTYLNLAKTNTMPAADWPAIREARGNIRQSATNLVDRLRHQKPAATTPITRFTGAVTAPDFEYNLLKNFDAGVDWFNDMKQVCAKHGIPAPIIVLMPVTDTYVKFHDKNVESGKSDRPRITYDEIYKKTLATLQADGLPYIDHWDVPRGKADYGMFRDSYHLNPGGADWLTKKLGKELPPLLASSTPATAPAAN